MRLGGRTIGPYKWDPRQADRLKYYAFKKRINIDEVIQVAVNALIDGDREMATEIDKELDRQYGTGGGVPFIRSVRDLREAENEIPMITEGVPAGSRPLYYRGKLAPREFYSNPIDIPHNLDELLKAEAATEGQGGTAVPVTRQDARKGA